MATMTAVVARATEEDAPDVGVGVGVGVELGAGVFSELGDAALEPLPLLLMAIGVAVGVIVLPVVILPAMVLLEELLEPPPQAFSMGMTTSVSSRTPISVQSPRPSALTAASTLLQAVLAQILGKTSGIGGASVVNEKPESVVHVGTSELMSSGEILPRSQVSALTTTASVAARVMSESFMVLMSY